MGFGLRGKLQAATKEIRIGLANKFARSNTNINSIYFQPSDMCEPDRLMLYALIRGLRPKRVLEIGARWGGGARIISSALEDAGAGQAIGIDPEPKAFRPSDAELHHRYKLLVGYSPQAIPEAVDRLGGPIDVALIDAMHTHDHVAADFNGVIPYMSPAGHVLLHDAFHVGINQAVEEILRANPSFTDCGILTRDALTFDEAPVAYHGLRLIRVGNYDPKAVIKDRFPKADFSPDLFNWDFYWNRIKDRQ